MYLIVTRTKLVKNRAPVWGSSAVTLQCSGWELIQGDLKLRATFQRPATVFVGPVEKVVVVSLVCILLREANASFEVI